MKRFFPVVLAAAGLLLGLLLLPAAPSASALIVCDGCSPFAEPGDPDYNQTCLGFCQGRSYWTCGEYVAAGCPLLFLVDPEEESKEAFLASLREQAPTAEEALTNRLNQETES
ncbi:MAG: hypothetical protein AAGD01_13860 [Acidobacteriota bacterium]